MFLIAGLGNPGAKYELTRHNAGFMAIDLISDEYNINLSDGGGCLTGGTQVEGSDLLLVKPTTFMNRSGGPIKKEALQNNVDPANIIVIFDDTEIPIGKIRIRKEGRSGGHNGVQSIIDSLGTTEFPRIKIGVGKPEGGEDLADYVLSPFKKNEEEAFDGTLLKTKDVIKYILKNGIDSISDAMNKFNG